MCIIKVTTKTWGWTENTQKEFEELRRVLNRMKATLLLDDNKTSILKTDASNTGLGAVLLQEVNGEMLPVQWPSRKTNTHRE